MKKEDRSTVQPRKKRRHRVRRIVITLIILVLAAGAGVYGYNRLRSEYRVTYDGYTAIRGSISNSLSYTGSVQLIDSKVYNASSAAKVREIYVSVGDRVKEGDKLVRLSNGDTCTADFDGIVNKVEVAKGDEVGANTALVQIADFDHMRVSFRIGESDIGDVSVNQMCRISVASAGVSFESKIATIDYASYTGNNVAYYTATVEVDASGAGNVYPGMQATVTIPQEEANDVVVLKMDAVSSARDNSAFVYKQQEDGTMLQVPVTVGVSNGNYVEIREGVSEGETVYAVAKQTDALSAWTTMMQQSFGSQQVNGPSGGFSQGGGYQPGNGMRNRNNNGSGR